ncbi:hypothetical protein ACIZ62_00710 [Acetobacterium carbinolicum]|uniref:hypothetical protein n=1 Tax=Acetobacterium carbinolicum TaxID=52690 RepID=UPI0039BEE025
MLRIIETTGQPTYRLVYLDGMIRMAKSLLAETSVSGLKPIMNFYAVKYFKAIEVEGITQEELEQLQSFRGILTDAMIGTIKQADLIRVYPPALKVLQ